MSLSIGIVGLPNVGKSTLFNALTDNSVLAANYPFATIEPNTGVVPVPDERLQKLSEMYAGAPIKPATVSFVDIAGLVEGAYLFNTSLNNFKIDVDVTGSTATIEGNVDTDVEKSLAEEIALSIDGIDKVDNRLTVASSSDKDAMQAAEVDQDQSDSKTFKEKLSDAAITTKVKSRLIANPQATGLDINVDTEDGTVTLNGQVESDTEKELAFYIAHNTGGVVSVKNRIEVKDPQDKTAAIN